MARKPKHKHKGANSASRKPPQRSAPPMLGPHEFDAGAEKAMRQGMRADRGALPTDGRMPQGAPPLPTGGDGDFDGM